MWTPKRILLLVAGFAIFLGGYTVYASFLGGIDGLPPLPQDYWPPKVPNPPPPPLSRIIDSGVDRKLRLAFGQECPQCNRTIKVEVKLRGLALAANRLDIEQDGRVKLTPFSIALFSKERNDQTFPEINTVDADEAYLTLDQRINHMTELGSRKIVGAELRGSITIINNRRTSQKNDDIEVRVSNGPLFFDEQKNKIWTDGFVKLLDTQTQPKPTLIMAKGMDLHLTREASPGPGKTPSKAPKRSSSEVGGVDLVVLRGNVEMHLHIDARSGFLAGSTTPAARPDAAPRNKPPVLVVPPEATPAGKAPSLDAPEKSHVVIKTQGPFTYDLQKDHAQFESPINRAAAGADLFPEQVLVTREHIVGTAKFYDQLVCDLLKLQFRRKKDVDPHVVRTDRTADREIETAHATARPGKEVTLSLDSENLHADGRELIYHSPKDDLGPQTILRGEPLHAVKDAHRITAQELHLIGANARGEGQLARARGPGQIDLLDRNSPSRTHQYHAQWKDMLIVTKDREGDKVYDLLTFLGEAAFIDDEHQQEMRAKKLQVWLEPPERQDPAEQNKQQKQSAPGAPKQRPHKIEGFENVQIHSAELKVNNSEHLVVRFGDGHSLQLPEALPNATASSGEPILPGTLPTPAVAAGPGLPLEAADGHHAVVAGKPTSGEKKKEHRQPIEVQAKRVSVYILRAGQKNHIHEVVTKGNVHVHQNGKTPQDKGVDIHGETLNLERHSLGDTLIVFGDSRAPAQMQLGELFLVGPEIHINQKDNTAKVHGVGAMHMPSNTTFDGGKPSKAGTRLTIHWTKDMFFNGKDADFRGGVVAYQDNASVRCDTMVVTLDKIVSFKEGQKGNQGAKVEKLLCHRKVYIADTKREPNGDLLRYERLVAHQLTMDNQQGPVIAMGPGKVFLLQYGTAEGLNSPVSGGIGAVPSPPLAPSTRQLQLTRVDFLEKMFSTTREDRTRIAKFYTGVEVYHLPADNPDVKIEVDKLPKGGLYMRCEQLIVITKPGPDNKAQQEMEGSKGVYFQTPDFYGRADTVKYDQSQEQIIFEGSSGNLATLYRPGAPGSEPEEIKGSRILYNRRDGRFHLDGGRIIQGTGR